MKVLVTGATGFIGSYLVPALVEKGYTVSIIVRDRAKAVDMFGDTVEIFEGDVTKPETLEDACSNQNAVIHLAALASHELPSATAFQRFRNVNVEGTYNLMKNCEKHGISRFLFISSTAAMGAVEGEGLNEETPCKPYTPYQVTKYETETMLLNEFRECAFPVIIVRPSMIYGPGYKGDLLTIAKLCKTGFFPKIGLGKNLGPAIFVTDFIKALMLILEKGQEGEVYLTTSENSYTLRYRAEIIGRALDKKMKFIYVPKWLLIAIFIVFDFISIIFGIKFPANRRTIKSISTDRVFCIDKLKSLGFATSISIDEGITKTINFFIKENYL
jgi:nucleoside-diphosphate-sugar epimerase